MRSNGWEKPVHYLQLITWIFFPTIMLLFFVCYIPLLSTKTAIISGIVYGILCMIVVYSVYRCTGTNPADDSISRTSNVVTATTVGDDQVYCNVCLHYVHKESRHCRLCDKCVEVFDHHCKWLNNCVGKKNYHFFLSSVVSTTTLLSIQAVLGIYLFYTVFHNPDVIRRRSASVFGCSNRIDPTTGLCRDGAYTISIQAIKIIHALLLAVVVPWWFLLAQLTLFHFQLCYEKITTYDYIVRKRKRKLQQERENAVRRPFHLRVLSLLQCQCKRLVYESPATPISGKSCNSHIESETKDETIEVQVDDDLEILSVTSEDDGRTRSFQARTKQEKKGFGKYVELGGKPTNGTSTASTVVHTPLALDPDAPFLVAPITPQSPRSDPSSAYHSEVSEPDERTTSTSVVMYGRMSTKDREMNHIV